MHPNPSTPAPRTASPCLVCYLALVAIAAIALVVIVLLLNPAPPPPDYSKIPLVTDQAWDDLAAQGWQTLPRTGKPVSVSQLGDAPISPANVMAMPFEGTQPNTEPSVVWHPLPSATEVYYEYWFKVSANWECNPAGCGKLSFIFPAAGGDSYVGIYCMDPPYGACATADQSPMRVGGQLQFPGGGGSSYPAGYPILPNQTTTPVYRDRWHHLAVYYKWSSSKTANDGIWRWWVDGTLNAEYTDVIFPIDPGIEFQFAMTKQAVPDPPNQFAWFDHTIVRATPLPGAKAVPSKTPRVPTPEAKP